jgi:hypothetical protein
MLIKKSFS